MSNRDKDILAYRLEHDVLGCVVCSVYKDGNNNCPTCNKDCMCTSSNERVEAFNNTIHKIAISIQNKEWCDGCERAYCCCMSLPELN